MCASVCGWVCVWTWEWMEGHNVNKLYIVTCSCIIYCEASIQTNVITISHSTHDSRNRI